MLIFMNENDGKAFLQNAAVFITNIQNIEISYTILYIQSTLEKLFKNGYYTLQL